MPKEYLFLLAGLAMGFLLGWLAGRRLSPEMPNLPSVEPTPASATEGAAVKLVVNGNTVEVSPTAMANIQGLIQSGQKIDAIKALREATGLNLAAAKSVIESLEKVM